MDKLDMQRSINVARRIALEKDSKCKKLEALLSDWLKFASDVQCNDTCGDDWLKSLIGATTNEINS